MNFKCKLFNRKENKIKQNIIEYYELLKLRIIVVKYKLCANEIHCSKYGMNLAFDSTDINTTFYKLKKENDINNIINIVAELESQTVFLEHKLEIQRVYGIYNYHIANNTINAIPKVLIKLIQDKYPKLYIHYLSICRCLLRANSFSELGLDNRNSSFSELDNINSELILNNKSKNIKKVSFENKSENIKKVSFEDNI
tara:strand:- start:59 stop:652 length:594 start_codon:yes stop_codon:yes gene_type:complete